MLPRVAHLTADQLAAGLPAIRASPPDAGALLWIALRPAPGERQIVDEIELDPARGAVGDSWCVRPSSRTRDHSPHPGMQITLMNARVIALLAPDRAQWAVAGDQLYVDLDLSGATLPPGSRLAVGDATLEVTPAPHTGCAKFTERFGSEASRWLNTEEGRALNLRGIHARVVVGGHARRGDLLHRVS